MFEALLAKRPVRYVAAFLISVALLLTMTFHAMGRPFRIAKIPDRGRNFGCATCHENPNGGGKRTSFGRDYERFGMPAGEKYTEQLGGLDSDGDGFSNDEEFDAGTHPGDPKSKPKGRSPNR